MKGVNNITFNVFSLFILVYNLTSVCVKSSKSCLLVSCIVPISDVNHWLDASTKHNSIANVTAQYFMLCVVEDRI